MSGVRGPVRQVFEGTEPNWPATRRELHQTEWRLEMQLAIHSGAL